MLCFLLPSGFLVAPGSTRSSLEQTFSRKRRGEGDPDASLIADAQRIWVKRLSTSRKAGARLSRLLPLGMPARSSLYRAAQKRKTAAMDSETLAKATTSSSWATLAHQRKPVDDALMKSIRWVPPNFAIDLMESGQQRTKKKK